MGGVNRTVHPVRALDAPRVAMLSVHTSPLDQPGTGDAGGMNVYVSGLAEALAARGARVDIFTRRTSPAQPHVVTTDGGVVVRHVTAGPWHVAKEDLPAHTGTFARNVLVHAGGPYDVVHSHYWLSGEVGRLAAAGWHVPLVHTMHTLAKVKNLALAPGDHPEPRRRVVGEEHVVAAAHALVASTAEEAGDLVELYDADPAAIHVVAPGVDLRVFGPGTDRLDDVGLARAQASAREEVGLPPHERVVLFAGRLQPLKAPDVLVRALGELAARGRPVPLLVVLGGPSGTSGSRWAERGLVDLAAGLGVADRVVVRPPVERTELARWYRAADVVAVPSRSESFGLVAAEAQACATPVLASAVGGLRTVVQDGVTGALVRGHDALRWARAIDDLLADGARRATLARRARRHAARLGWDAAAEAMLKVYALAQDRSGLAGRPDPSGATAREAAGLRHAVRAVC